MITTIETVIKQLEEIKQKHGDIMVRTACQVTPNTVDFDAEVIDFYNESKTAKFVVLVIKGYRAT